MTVEIWLAFVAASAFVLIVPGPTVTLVVSYALAEGRRSSWHTVSGVTLGVFVSMTLSLLGFGALLATSATLFTIFKWAGAAYLVYLGVRMWLSRPEVAEDGVSVVRKRGSAMFVHAFLVTASNPKTIAFFVAFLPQFINASAPVLPQIIILEATFLVLAAIDTAAYAILASRAREAIGRPAFLKRVNRIGGSMLIGAGVMTAALRRTQ